MLSLQEITIDKKEEITRYIRRKCSMNSEFTFTNLFMWRKSYDIRYVILEDMLCIMPQHAGGPRSATFPIGYRREDGTEGNIKKVIETLIQDFQEKGEVPLIRLYDETAVEKLEELFPGRFLITEDVNSFDYVYKTEELIALSGKKFHQKKNHVNQFKKQYNYAYHTLTEEQVPDCIALFERWCAQKEETTQGMEEEREAVLELFHNWGNLDVKGGYLTVDDKMIAFSVGEPLCGKMAVIHLEHADTAYRGAFAMMNQQFLEHTWQDFEYVNREEDMGIPGMRKAKESYRPVCMVKKYVATLKEDLL